MNEHVEGKGNVEFRNQYRIDLNKEIRIEGNKKKKEKFR
jgi:hypothetical protein